MGTEDGREGPDLIRELFRAPHRFDFFQAVRLLGQLGHERAEATARRPPSPVGEDDPFGESVRFKVPVSLHYPTSTVGGATDAQGRGPAELLVNCFGLSGPNGVLPRHYTELLIERVRDRDTSLRDFLDLFHHRLISLFYRAWEKYRLPVGYERAQLTDEPDPVTFALQCLVGLGEPGLQGRLGVGDEVFLHYSGHFAHHPRSASALESLLEDYLETPVQVLQAQGQWLALESDSVSLLPNAANPVGRNNALGVDLILGDRVWDVQGQFRLRLGPLGWDQFRDLLPESPGLRALAQLTRMFVGPELNFSVQPLLCAAEVPAVSLAPDPASGFFLGWTTWLGDPERQVPADDAVFEVVDV